MSIKEFERTFNLSTTIEREKERFVKRMEIAIFNSEGYRDDYILFKDVCYELGEDLHMMVEEHYQLHKRNDFRTAHPSYSVITGGNFYKTLSVLMALHAHLLQKPELQSLIDNYVIDALDKSTIELGIRWKEGVAYPSGDKILDAELVDGAFAYLTKHPEVKLDLTTALKHYYQGNHQDVVTNCFKAIEGLAHNILDNQKVLDNNKEKLLKNITLSPHWKSILNHYIKFSHEFRHASETRHDIPAKEIESYLYLTCLLIRLIVNSEE